MRRMFSLTQRPFQILEALEASHGHEMLMQDLHPKVPIHKATFSYHLRRLQERGLLRIVEYEGDARQRLVVITPDGLAALHLLRDLPDHRHATGARRDVVADGGGQTAP